MPKGGFMQPSCEAPHDHAGDPIQKLSRDLGILLANPSCLQAYQEYTKTQKTQVQFESDAKYKW